MKLGVLFSANGWDDYKSWTDDRVMRRRIDRLIEDLRRNPEGEGLGKRERLSGLLGGWSSARITEEHRLVYQVTSDWINISQCRGHYGDK